MEFHFIFLYTCIRVRLYRMLVPRILYSFKISEIRPRFHVCGKHSLSFFTREANFRRSASNFPAKTRRILLADYAFNHRHGEPLRDSIWCSTPSKFASILRTQACDDNSACVPSKFLKGKYFLACGAPWQRVTIASDECLYTFT